MNNSGKWIFRILVLLLAVTLIDLNLNQTRVPAGTSKPEGTVNLILAGALALVLLFGWILSKKNK